MNIPTAFLRILDPTDNVTGGGAASAVAGAMAASLVGMVARISIGKKNMPDPDSHYQELDTQAQTLSLELLAGADRDSQAFDQVMAAYRLPKTTGEEKSARRQAIQNAMAHATRVPLANARGCAQALAYCARLEGRSNPNAASDLECARFLALAGLRGALSNAQINIASIEDEALAAGLTAEARELSHVLEGPL